MGFWRDLFSTNSSNALGVNDGVLGKPEPPRIGVDEALTVPVVYGAVQMIHNTMISLPLQIKQRDVQATNASIPAISSLLENRPNAYQTWIAFRGAMQFNLSFTGNAYALITRNSSGRVISLDSLPSEQVEVSLDAGKLTYTYSMGKNKYAYGQDRILHVKTMGNGLKGISFLDYAKDSLGLAINANKAANSTFTSNAMSPEGVFYVDASITPQQRKAINERYGNTGAVKVSPTQELLIIEGGLRYEPSKNTLKDLQAIESRTFQVDEVSRFFGIPSVMLNSTNSVSSWGSGIEQLMKQYYTTCILPIMIAWDSELTDKLLSREERKSYRFKHNAEGLLRASSKDRGDFYRTMGGDTPKMTVNEIRLKEDLPPIAGGDVLHVSQNLQKTEG